MQTALLFAAAWVALSAPIGMLIGRIIAYGQRSGATASTIAGRRPRIAHEQGSPAALARDGR